MKNKVFSLREGNEDKGSQFTLACPATSPGDIKR